MINFMGLGIGKYFVCCEYFVYFALDKTKTQNGNNRKH